MNLEDQSVFHLSGKPHSNLQDSNLQDSKCGQGQRIEAVSREAGGPGTGEGQGKKSGVQQSGRSRQKTAVVVVLMVVGLSWLFAVSDDSVPATKTLRT
jgi:hypothetical protein